MLAVAPKPGSISYFSTQLSSSPLGPVGPVGPGGPSFLGYPYPEAAQPTNNTTSVCDDRNAMVASGSCMQSDMPCCEEACSNRLWKERFRSPLFVKQHLQTLTKLVVRAGSCRDILSTLLPDMSPSAMTAGGVTLVIFINLCAASSNNSHAQ